MCRSHYACDAVQLDFTMWDSAVLICFMQETATVRTTGFKRLRYRLGFGGFFFLRTE